MRNVAAVLSRHPAATVAAMTAAGAALRFWRIDYQSVWLDEAVSALISRESLPVILDGAGLDEGNPPLFHLLLALWSYAFGYGDVAIRSLSAVIGIITLPAMYWLGRKLLGTPAGLTAAGLMAFSPLHIYYSQEARTYALAVLLSLLSTLALVLVLEKPRSTLRWSAYVLASFLGILSHYFVGCVLVAHNVYVLWACRKDPGQLRKWFAAQAGIGILYLAWLPILLRQVFTQGNLSRYADTWLLHLAATPMAFSVGRTLVWKGDASAAGMALAAAGTLAFGAAFVAGLVEMRRRSVRERSLIVLTAAAPVVLPAIVSAFFFPMYAIQYAIPALPAFYLVVAGGIVGLPGRWRRPIAAVAATAVLAAIAYQAHHLYKHDWKRCVPYVESRSEPTDIIAFDAEQNEKAYARYARRDTPRYRLYLRDGQAEGTIMAVPPGGRTVEDVSAAIGGPARIWLVLSDVNVGSRGHYARVFGASRTCTHAADFQGIEVKLCTITPRR